MGLNTDPPKASQGYAFGPLTLDPVRRMLYRGTDVVPITAKTFDVLLILVANRERIVTKDELLKTAWADVVVQENNLVRQISMLRRLLHERPDAHEFIVTVTGQGYRFVAPVEEVELSKALPQDDTTPSLEVPSPVDSAGGVGWPAPTAIILLVVAAGAGIFYANRPATDSWQGRPLTQVTYDPTLPRSPSWAPDGRSFAFVSDRAGSPDIWKQRLDDPDPIQLTTTATMDSEPDWSPDGSQIVFRSERDEGGLYLMSADGGTARRIAPFGRKPRWSPDGKMILFKRSTTATAGSPNYYVLNVQEGTPPTRLRPEVQETFASAYAAWRPDGRISVWGRSKAGHREFVTVGVESSDVARASITATVAEALDALSPGGFVWAPTERFLVFEGNFSGTGDLWRVNVDPKKDRWTHAPERLTTGLGDTLGIALSPDGTRLLYAGSSTQARLWAFPFDGASGRIDGEPIPLTSGSMGEMDADTPRDGSKIAYRARRAGRSELWERTIADGTERLLVSSGEWRHTTPRWSPDGARIAYSRIGGESMGLVDVAVLSAAGGVERSVTQPGEIEFLPWDWRLDSSAILGACRIDGNDRFGTCLLPLPRSSQVDPSPVEVIASDPALDLFNQEFSPNEQWISFMAIDPTRTETSAIYVIPAAGGEWIPVTKGTAFDDKPSWSRDGRALYFVSDRNGMLNVWGRRWNSTSGHPVGEPFVVTDFQSPRFMLNSRTAAMDIELTYTDLLLPISETVGQVWMLDGVDR